MVAKIYKHAAFIAYLPNHRTTSIDAHPISHVYMYIMFYYIRNTSRTFEVTVVT